MDERVKNALGIVGVVAVALIAIASLTAAGALSRSATAGATFSVSGQGKASGVPDVAQFTFSVTTQGGLDIASLQRENIAKANEAIEFLKSEDVEAKDIETLGYDIQPRYQSFNCRPQPFSPGAEVQPCPPSEIVGYTVTQTVQVKARDFSKTGSLISGVTERGANSVSGLNFTVDNPSQLQNEARAKAIQDAKEQAKSMAKAGGFKLGRLVLVSENGGHMPFARDLALESMANVGSSAPAPTPSLEPGSEQATAMVTLTYEIR
jgi:hypothetical protein